MEIINLGEADGLPPVDWAAVVEKLVAGSAPAPDAVTRALARVAAGYLRFVTSRRVLPLGDEPIGELDLREVLAPPERAELCAEERCVGHEESLQD